MPLARTSKVLVSSIEGRTAQMREIPQSLKGSGFRKVHSDEVSCGCFSQFPARMSCMRWPKVL